MNFVSWLFWCFVAVVTFGRVKAGGHGGHHHVKIIVPYHVKTIKHTHTIYKTIHHKDDKGGKKDGHSHGGKKFDWN